jgi:triosephosphate isomerase (TIM)
MVAKIVIANWKMKLGAQQATALASAVQPMGLTGPEIVICPSFVHLARVADILKKGKVRLGAQDVFWEAAGAFTGEVSAAQLKELGCQYVIIGHSERRAHLAETDEMVHRKTKAAVAAGLTPIICVGETFEERQKGGQDYVLIHQVSKALEGINLDAQPVIVAYEPVWVIGSGHAIEPADAQSAHQVIRQTLIDLFPLSVVDNQVRIIYGGSVDSSNVAQFTGLEHTTGVLVGGASLNAQNFAALISNV